MSPANVVPLHRDQDDAAGRALTALDAFLDRSKLSDSTGRAYRRQARAYLDWLAANHGRHPDAFRDDTGAEGAVTVWRRHLLAKGDSPASVNQALAAVTLLYRQGARIRIEVKRARVNQPGAPDALTSAEQGAVQRAADRRGIRDAAIVALLFGSGPRVEECAHLAVDDVTITARTGTVRLLGKGDQLRTVAVPTAAREKVTAWLDHRASLLDGKDDHGRLWIGQAGPMTVSGITKVVLAVGADAGLAGLRPHRLRHTFATRLRQGGADPAVIQAALGHTSIQTTQRYFRASDQEIADTIDRILG